MGILFARRREILLLTALPALAALSPAPAAAAGNTEISLGSEHAWGRYGAARDTDCRTELLAIRHWRESWALSLAIPYLRISGPAAVVGSLGNQTVFTPSSGMVERSAEGPGDMEAAVSRLLLDDPAGGWRADLGARWKFPTGDAGKGLGTGSSDQALETSLQRRVGRLDFFTTLGWRHMGNAGSTVLENVRYGGAGAGLRLSPMAQAGVAWSYREALVQGGAPLRLGTAFLNLAVNQGLTLQAYLLRGRSDSSPDNGAGITANWAY